MVRLVRPADGAELVRLPLPGQGKFHPRCFAGNGGRLYVTDLETGRLFVWDLRLLQQGLSEFGLAWAAPPIPSPAPPEPAWRVEFVGANRLSQAWATTVKAAWTDPIDANVRTRLAALTADPENARVHSSLALMLAPDRADARYYRAQANLRLKRYEEAEADAVAVLRAVPGHFGATRIRREAEAALQALKAPRSSTP